MTHEHISGKHATTVAPSRQNAFHGKAGEPLTRIARGSRICQEAFQAYALCCNDVLCSTKLDRRLKSSAIQG